MTFNIARSSLHLNKKDKYIANIEGTSRKGELDSAPSNPLPYLFITNYIKV